jgi:beta-glucosidase-like glycosyl hydrolase
LRAKLAANLFERYASDGTLTPHYTAVQARLTDEFGSARHRELAREAVQKSLGLLKNARRTLPITGRRYCRLYVAEKNADGFGSQLGGWTLGWQGRTGNAKKGPLDRTILDGLRARGEQHGMEVLFSRDATFAAPQRDCSSSLAWPSTARPRTQSSSGIVMSSRWTRGTSPSCESSATWTRRSRWCWFPAAR